MNRNITKEIREKILEYLREFKNECSSSETDRIRKIQEIYKYIDSDTFGIRFERHSEDVLERLTKEVPVFYEDKTRKIFEQKTGMNFIIEGDNLHSLYLLERTHKHAIDVIYIDPPYNTGAKDWKYNNRFVDKNDGYRHSLWLSMMYERLKIAKNLLTLKGVLVCAIDENELATLSLLIEDVFGLDYHIDTVCIVHNPRGVQGDNFSYTNEYALFVYKKGTNPILPREINENDIDWRDLRDNGHESLRTDAATCFYSIDIDPVKKSIIRFGPNKTNDDSFHPQRNVKNLDGTISIYPIDIQGIERKWRYCRESVEEKLPELRIKCVDGVYDIELGKNTGTYRTVWTGKIYDSNEYGTKLVNDMVPENDFDFPKSLYNTYECLNAVIRNKPNALVLDFFAGSGTTGHAVLLMNKLLGGNRRFILCTNNAVGEKKEKEFAELYPHLVNPDKTIITDSDEYRNWEEKYGIARSVTYPRIKAAIKGYCTQKSKNKTLLFDSKLSVSKITNQTNLNKLLNQIERIKTTNANLFTDLETKIEDDSLRIYGVSKSGTHVPGLGGNVSYFKTSFVPIVCEDDSLLELTLSHTKEMIDLFEMSCVDEKHIVKTDEDLENVIKNIGDFSNSNIYIWPDVLIEEEEKNKLAFHNIKYHEVPQLFFGKELRKAGEL